MARNCPLWKDPILGRCCSLCCSFIAMWDGREVGSSWIRQIYIWKHFITTHRLPDKLGLLRFISSKVSDFSRRRVNLFIINPTEYDSRDSEEFTGWPPIYAKLADVWWVKMVLNILQHIRGLNDFLIWHEIAEIDVFPKVQQGVKWFCKWFQMDFLGYIFQQFLCPLEIAEPSSENTLIVSRFKFIVIKCKKFLLFQFTFESGATHEILVKQWDTHL